MIPAWSAWDFEVDEELLLLILKAFLQCARYMWLIVLSCFQCVLQQQNCSLLQPLAVDLSWHPPVCWTCPSNVIVYCLPQYRLYILPSGSETCINCLCMGQCPTFILSFCPRNSFVWTVCFLTYCSSNLPTVTVVVVTVRTKRHPSGMWGMGDAGLGGWEGDLEDVGFCLNVVYPMIVQHSQHVLMKLVLGRIIFSAHIPSYSSCGMWWHTCKDQISSFPETDESI
jgi:hypothetical protein